MPLNLGTAATPRDVATAAAQSGRYDARILGGAKGDGVTDDRFALYFLDINVNGNGVVEAPPGIYRVASDLTLSSFWRALPNAIFKPDAGVTITFAGGFDGDLSKHFDLSAGGTVRISAARTPDIYAQWWGATFTGVPDESAIIAAAIQSVDTTGGAGGRVRLGGPAVNVGTTGIVLRDNVRVVGLGRRATIINYSGAGRAIDARDCIRSGLSGARVFVGTNPAAIALDESTVTRSVMYNDFDDLDLVGAVDQGIAGQIGIKRVTNVGNIISANTHTRINVLTFARPLVGSGPEGNFFVACTIDTFGSGDSSPAIDDLSHVDFYEFRMAGNAPGVTNAIGYQQQGDRNIARIVCDHGGKALNVTGSFNDITVRRADGSTPLGTFAVSNTVHDEESTTLRRVRAGGSAIDAACFSNLTGFGATATISNISGTDQRFSLSINAAGAGQAANAFVDFVFKDGAWLSAPVVLAVRSGGSQIGVPVIVQPSAFTAAGFRLLFAGTPVAGESYTVTVMVMG